MALVALLASVRQGHLLSRLGQTEYKACLGLLPPPKGAVLGDHITQEQAEAVLAVVVVFCNLRLMELLVKEIEAAVADQALVLIEAVVVAVLVVLGLMAELTVTVALVQLHQ